MTPDELKQKALALKADADTASEFYLADQIPALCDALVQVVDECEEMRQNYNNACKLVAEMHAAAVGEIRGPSLGVVEDVAALRDENTRLKQAAQVMDDALDIYGTDTAWNEDGTFEDQEHLAREARSKAQAILKGDANG